jgi:predicted transcriptional regulator
MTDNDQFVDLTTARLNLGLSQRGLAEQAGVGLETIRRLERGDGCRPANAKRVADVVGCKVTDLMPVEVSAS